MFLFSQLFVLKCRYGAVLDITRTELLPDEHDEAMKGQEGLKLFATE